MKARSKRNNRKIRIVIESSFFSVDDIVTQTKARRLLNIAKKAHKALVKPFGKVPGKYNRNYQKYVESVSPFKMKSTLTLVT